MTERSIERVLQLEASPERVWKAITDPVQLSQWFGDHAEMDLRPGGLGAMTWDEHGRFAVRVEVVDPPQRLVWSWVHQAGVPFDEAPSTRVEWSLSRRDDGGTTLTLRETGFRTDEHHEQNTEGWKAELDELVTLLTAAA